MNQTKNVFFMLIALVALAVAAIALYNARIARELALSDISIEERSPLLTPVYNEESGTWTYLAIYEVNLTNVSGPAVALTSISKEISGTGFLVPLKGEEVVSEPLKYKAFLVEPTLPEITTTPKLLKTLLQQDMGESASMNVQLARGVSKSIRFGLSIEAYDSAKQPLSQIVLVSFRLNFDNGKSMLFRRGIPIQPLID